MTVLRLLILPPQSGDPPELIEADGVAITRRRLASDELLEGGAILVAPGADVVTRWMDLPVGSPAQARSAAAFRLEDEVALGDGGCTSRSAAWTRPGAPWWPGRLRPG
ncbi:hypothetical protein [Caulobacter sp. B11]|uniref:hypothetical protein n=1 Tax=Caulobacter sp. B11 TaxID=2048899 RepID=UPI001F43EC81|nr:hypothetical protein [Caulobacter sp. B11]